MPGILDQLHALMLSGVDQPARQPLQIDPAAGGFQAAGPGGILGRAMEPPLWGAIRQAYKSLGGGGDAVRLNDLRTALPNVPREDMDSALLGMKKGGEAVLMNLDNPKDIASVGDAALKSGQSTYHTLWLDPTRSP